MTGMVQVAVAGDVAEAEEMQEILRDVGIDSSIEQSAEDDAVALRLPDEPFAVVANLPFAVGTAILRRLLGDPGVPLIQVDVIVEWGLAAKRTAVWPSTVLGCTWGAWYELTLSRRVPRAC